MTNLSGQDLALLIPAPFAFIVEIIVESTPDPIAYRFVNSKSSVFFGHSTTGIPLEYLPAPISITPIESSASGNLPQIVLEVGITDQIVRANIIDHGYLLGCKTNVRLVNTGNLGDAAAVRKFVFEVVELDLVGVGVRATLGIYNITRAQNPPQRYSRDVCRHPYGDPGTCGYDLSNPTLLAAHPTCSRSRYGANGCAAHGEAELAASVTVLHPLRFGGRPGIPVERRFNS